MHVLKDHQWLIAVVTCIASGTPSLAEQLDAAASRRAALKELVEGEGPTPFMNGSLLVIDGDKEVFRSVRGFADFRTREPLTASSVFQIASTAKPFTATAILQLRDAGRLRLDDPVARHLSSFPFPDITLRHLLSHTSGLPDAELFEDIVARDPDVRVSGADLIPALRAWSKPLSFQPGDRFRYTNVNYQLLAQVVEAVAGQPFGAYVRDRIFRPARMRSSYVLGTAPIARKTAEPVKNHERLSMFSVEPEDVVAARVLDPVWARRHKFDVTNVGYTVGDQNVFTTLDDLRLFDRALRSNRILSLSSQAESYAPTRLNDGTTYLDAEEYQLYGVRCSYGLGWEVCAHPRYGQLIGHAGYNRGIQIEFYRNPAHRRLIVMFDNSSPPDFAARFAAVASVAGGDPAPLVDRRMSLERAFGDVLVREGATSGLIFYLRNRADARRWTESRPAMNALGYDLLRAGKPALALEPFRLNVVNHPEHAGIWDSLGDGLAANDRKEEARQAFARSLELDPDQDRTRKKYEALQAASAAALGP